MMNPILAKVATVLTAEELAVVRMLLDRRYALWSGKDDYGRISQWPNYTFATLDGAVSSVPHIERNSVHTDVEIVDQSTGEVVWSSEEYRKRHPRRPEYTTVQAVKERLFNDPYLDQLDKDLVLSIANQEYCPEDRIKDLEQAIKKEKAEKTRVSDFLSGKTGIPELRMAVQTERISLELALKITEYGEKDQREFLEFHLTGGVLRI